jgi:hypothetical protein
MLSWGLAVNDYGNAILDDDGGFIKLKGEGVDGIVWDKMLAYAGAHNLKGGNVKKLNLPFENILLGQPKAVRERMVRRVEDFIYHMLVDVFNARDTASTAIEIILSTGTHDPGPKAQKTEDPSGWTRDRIIAKAASISSDKGPEGDFDD